MCVEINLRTHTLNLFIMKNVVNFPRGATRGMLAFAFALGLAVQPLCAQDQKTGTEVRKVKIVQDVNGQVTVVEKEVPAGVDVHEFLRSEGLGGSDLPEMKEMPPLPEDLQKGDRVEVNVEVGPDGQAMRHMTVVRDGKVVVDELEAGEQVLVFSMPEGQAGEMEWVEKEGATSGEKRVIVRKMECDGTGKGEKHEMRMIMIRIEDLDKTDAPAQAGEAKQAPLPLETLDLFPNPNDGKFTLRFRTEESSKPVHVRISDMTGKTILERKLKVEAGEYSESFDLSAFPKGAYLLQLDQQGKTTSKKIILQ